MNQGIVFQIAENLRESIERKMCCIIISIIKKYVDTMD